MHHLPMCNLPKGACDHISTQKKNIISVALRGEAVIVSADHCFCGVGGFQKSRCLVLYTLYRLFIIPSILAEKQSFDSSSSEKEHSTTDSLFPEPFVP